MKASMCFLTSSTEVNDAPFSDWPCRIENPELATVVQQSGAPAIDLEVNFAFDSAAITPAAAVTLSKLGQALRSKELSVATFLLSGHTDARGGKHYNQKLSEERAKAVRSFLIDNFSIEPTRMLAVGYGYEQLKNPANPEADENRRVQVVNLTR
jgi:outer membrane protein OmpA-like peptidoglycan-associated protein